MKALAKSTAERTNRLLAAKMAGSEKLEIEILEDSWRESEAFVRAILADEVPKYIASILEPPKPPTRPDEAAKAPQPEAAGDVPEWCKLVAKQNLSGVGFYDRPDLIGLHAERIQKYFDDELSRRVAEAVADKDKRIGELAKENLAFDEVLNKRDDQLAASQAEVERLTSERDNWTETARQHLRNEEFYRDIVHRIGHLFGVAARTSDDGSVQDSVLALKVPELVESLRSEASRLTRPVEGVTRSVTCFHEQWFSEIDFQRERNAREAAEKRAEAAERERDEWISACKELFDAPHDEHFCVRMNYEETQAMNKIRDLLAAYRAEKGKVQA